MLQMINHHNWRKIYEFINYQSHIDFWHTLNFKSRTSLDMNLTLVQRHLNINNFTKSMILLMLIFFTWFFICWFYFFPWFCLCWFYFSHDFAFVDFIYFCMILLVLMFFLHNFAYVDFLFCMILLLLIIFLCMIQTCFGCMSPTI